DALAQLNNLSNADQLTVGQQLVLPGQPQTTQAAANKPASKPKPAAKPTASPAPTTSPLVQRVSAEAARVAPNARVGVAATNLVTGERIALHGDDTFPSASVMKLPILVELERQTASGALAWTDSLRSEAGAMISVSDNTAADQVADAIHLQSVNDTMS